MKIKRFEKYKEVLKIAVPTAAVYLLAVLENMIDMKMMSSMGAAGIAAVNVTLNPTLFMHSLPSAIAMCITILISHYIVTGERGEAHRIMIAGLIISITYGILASIGCVCRADEIIGLCNADMVIQEDAAAYFRVLSAFMVVPAISLPLTGVMQAIGRSRALLKSEILGGIVNIVLDYLLIGGKFGLPALGITGAAIATCASRIAFLIPILICLLAPNSEVNLAYPFQNRIGLSGKQFAKIVRTGFGLWIENMITRAGLLMTSRISTYIGTELLAIYFLGLGIMSMNMAMAMGLQTAGITILGRELKLGNPDRLEEKRKLIIKSSVILSALIMIWIALISYPYFMFFFHDRELSFLGLISSIFIVAITPAQVMQIVMTGILRTFGKSKYSICFGIFCTVIVNPICAYILVEYFYTGLWGVWIASFVSQVIRLLLCVSLSRKTTLEIRTGQPGIGTGQPGIGTGQPVHASGQLEPIPEQAVPIPEEQILIQYLPMEGEEFQG